MNRKNIFLSVLGLGVIALIIGLILPSGGAVSLENLHIQEHFVGGADAKVTLTEFGDFQCPACGQYHPMVEELRKDYGDSLKVVFHEFPLTSVHPQAVTSAVAAEAAGLQGKFWEMHNKLYEGQKDWAENADASSIFEGYAKDIGIDVDQFKKDVVRKDIRAFVLGEAQKAIDAGYQGTPTFLLNGNKIENPGSVDAFKALIDPLLGKTPAVTTDTTATPTDATTTTTTTDATSTTTTTTTPKTGTSINPASLPPGTPKTDPTTPVTGPNTKL